MNAPRAERRTLARLSVIAGSAATLAASWIGVVRVDSAAPEVTAALPPTPDAARAALGTPTTTRTPTPAPASTPAATATASRTSVAAPPTTPATSVAAATPVAPIPTVVQTVAPPTPAATAIAPVTTPAPAPAPVQRATTRRSRAS